MAKIQESGGLVIHRLPQDVVDRISKRLRGTFPKVWVQWHEAFKTHYFWATRSPFGELSVLWGEGKIVGSIGIDQWVGGEEYVSARAEVGEVISIFREESEKCADALGIQTVYFHKPDRSTPIA
ncbi:MAG: hypothetical protein Q7R79_03145 [bacterium]|nr:hypothetical protein [bacterium]